MALSQAEESLLATLELRREEIADRAAHALGRLDQYAAVGDDAFIEDIREHLSGQFRLFLQSVRAGHASEEEVRRLAMRVMTRRVEQGLTLDGLLRGVGVAQRSEWESMMRVATAQGVSAESIMAIAARCRWPS